jgi:antitoxin (DNA-binding transcriptional repressor) of toxin-antitoxin stability system
MARRFIQLLLPALLVMACTVEANREVRPRQDPPPPRVPCTEEGVVACHLNVRTQCIDGYWSSLEECTEPLDYCHPDLGCLVCDPGRTYCEDNSAYQCAPDGYDRSFLQECGADEVCLNGQCINPCNEVRQRYSYLGCEFLAVSSSNSLLNSAFDNDFGVVVANPEGSPATARVTVERAGQTIATRSIEPGEVEAIRLSMVNDLRYGDGSDVVANGAYEVRSNTPVVAYQYNPLNFQLSDQLSFTNDASLLLPEHVLTGNYLASTWPTWGAGEWTESDDGLEGEWFEWDSGFVVVAAVQDGTQVTITSSGSTVAGTVPALQPGESTVLTLDRGDVLQLLSFRPPVTPDYDLCSAQNWQSGQSGTCPPVSARSCLQFCSVSTADLTGTRVQASAPVAVFAGHNCTFIPRSWWACDHLEEMMFPLETWGDLVVMSAPIHPDGGDPVSARYRILANTDDTLVEFDPPVAAPVVLSLGEIFEFGTDDDFVVRASDPIYVTQTLLGQNALGSQAGDPAMGGGIPWSQARSNYDFLTPSTYTSNWVNVAALTGSQVSLDGRSIQVWDPIEGTDYSVARLALGAGAHRIQSDDGSVFSLTTYGYASYTSYLLPGGMDLRR